MKNNMLETLSPLQNAVLNLLQEKMKGMPVEENVAQMQDLIELLSVCHCARVGNRKDAQYMVDLLHAHLSQVLDSYFVQEQDQSITGDLMKFR